MNLDPAPIEPPPLLGRPAADPVLEEIKRLGPIRRTLVALMLAAVALIFGMTALVLGTIHHWAVFVFVLGVVEPLALFLLCGALYCLAPSSLFGRLFNATLHRAKPVLIGLLVVFNLFVIGGLSWVLVMYFKSR